MDRLEIKVEKFKTVGEQIFRLRGMMSDMNLEYPSAPKKIREKIDQTLERMLRELKRLKKKLPKFTVREWKKVSSHDEKYIYDYLRICPFCREHIGHFNSSILCDKCGYLFYEE